MVATTNRARMEWARVSCSATYDNSDWNNGAYASYFNRITEFWGSAGPWRLNTVVLPCLSINSTL